ncbi:MAG TPA: hypothetical protein VJX74_14190 [Blastocatellia bacterium]|nr:hypothetical protein [Blastocatellia bacterium]
MRKLAFMFAAIFWLSIQAVAQSSDELAVLRSLLKVSDATPVSTAKALQLPIERPLKVYISTGDDSSVLKELTQLVQDVNKKSGDKPEIEVVADASKANLFLIHYEPAGKRHKEMKTSLSMDPALGRGRTDYVVSTEVRDYIVARKADGMEILSQHTRKVTVGERRKELRNDFSSLLKEQSKSNKR